MYWQVITLNLNEFQRFRVVAPHLRCVHQLNREKEVSETELVLKDAVEIAKRYFIDPTEQAVMQIFGRLSFERELVQNERDEHRGSIH